MASVVHRQETVDCLKKFNARRKLKVGPGTIEDVVAAIKKMITLTKNSPNAFCREQFSPLCWLPATSQVSI